MAIDHTEGYIGEIVKSALVTTNDPQNPNLTLSLRALFKMEGRAGAVAAAFPTEQRLGPFGIQPSNRWAVEIFYGETANTTINLINREIIPIHVKKLVPGGGDFTATLQTVEGGKEYKLLVAINPGLQIGRYTQKVTLVTDRPDMPEILIELEANVRGRVFATPASLNLPGLTLDALGPGLTLGTIYVRRVGESGLKIRSVDSNLPFVQPEVTAQAEGQLYTIRLTVNKSKVTMPSKFRGTIRVKTNDAVVPVIRIPVQGSFS